MRFFRPHLFVLLLVAIISSTLVPTPFSPRAYAQEAPPQPQQQQRLVEDVRIVGNRRLRQDDLLYYVQTKQGDTFNEAQVQRDFQALLALTFFDKTASRVYTEDGPKGGVIVVFEVRELPIIRDIQFEGLKAVTESDVLKAFREQRVGISKESVFDPVRLINGVRVIKELLAARGYPNATVDPRQEEVSQTSTAITFVVNQGERVRVVEIDFEGNENFSDGELRAQMKYVREAGLITRFRGQDILDRQKLDFDLRNVRQYMASKGYLNARLGEPRIEGLGERRTGFFIPLPLLSSTDEALRITVPVVQGRVYRVGEVKIEGNSIFSEQVIRSVLGLTAGEVANGQRISKALYEDLRKAYGSQGFIQYEAEVAPEFRDNAQNLREGVADFTITINEGKQFTLRRLEFLGNTFTRDNVLRREVLVNEGDVYNQLRFEQSVLFLNQLGFFDPIDKDRDADFRTDEEAGTVDLTVRVAERGRQQISFNGGISGIGGSFFGLEYSTNNFLGRGETLSFNLAYGNRQRSFYFSFTEPYIRNRPITTGFTLYTRSLKFVGPGTFLSQNTEAQQAALNPFDFSTSNSENLFTQTEYGLSFFASSRLSEFYRRRSNFTQATRIGLSYSLSSTSVEDPPVNAQGNAATFIPIIYSQTGIVTSRITPSFVYDTRNASIDPTTGKQLALSLAFAGLGGDVRTYQPFATYSQFIPVRRRRSDNPEVFAFRVVAGFIGSFATTDTVRNSNSLAFVNGVPIFERFYLGDEFTIRGFEPRSIGPRTPIDTFISSQNVTLASNAGGTPLPIPGLNPALANIGVFTGAGGANPVRINQDLPAFALPTTGGDTQLLGNFEYRIPLFGPVSAAAFLDIGSAFNLRKPQNQFINTNFLADDPFLSSVGAIPLRGGVAGVSLSTLAALNNPQLALSPLGGGVVLRDARLVSQEELNNALRIGPTDPLTGLPFGFQQAFLRGDAQTNTVVRLQDSLFSGIGNYRASVGGELRIQVPVVNVPFRLIFAYNPNARTDLLERRRVFRFSIGRTF